MLLKDEGQNLLVILLYKIFNDTNKYKTAVIEFMASKVKGGGTRVMEAFKLHAKQVHGCRDILVQSDKGCRGFYEKMHFVQMSKAKHITYKSVKSETCFSGFDGVVRYWADLRPRECQCVYCSVKDVKYRYGQ